MTKIRAKVGHDSYTNTSFYKTFFIENSLPEIGDTDGDVTVVTIENYTTDFQQGNVEAYNYNYYCIVEENEDKECYENYIAIKKPEDEWVY